MCLHPVPNLAAHIAKNIWTGDPKLGYYYISLNTLKASHNKRRKTTAKIKQLHKISN
jgi:hypothetical protein